MVVESVYTADLKSAGLRPCGFESRPRYQINIMRTLVNLEKAQIELVLAMFGELEEARDLKALEIFLRLVFRDAVDRASRGM